jgi:hypothetical protein
MNKQVSDYDLRDETLVPGMIVAMVVWDTGSGADGPDAPQVGGDTGPYLVTRRCGQWGEKTLVLISNDLDEFCREPSHGIGRYRLLGFMTPVTIHDIENCGVNLQTIIPVGATPLDHPPPAAVR